MTGLIHITGRQVAERPGAAWETVWRWRAMGHFPKPYKPSGNMTRWRLADTEAWEGSLRIGFAVALARDFSAPLGSSDRS